VFGVTMAGRAMQKRQDISSPRSIISCTRHPTLRSASTPERLLGVRDAGRAASRTGDQNALIALGPSTYLEIIGPDPISRSPRRRDASASTN
jgi:hypothetical protein